MLKEVSREERKKGISLKVEKLNFVLTIFMK